MNKEIEALDWLLENEMIYRGRTRLPISPALREIKHRLESIDNSNPSEALECLKHIKKYYIPEPCSAKTYDCLETIKQALIKAEKDRKELENPLNIRPCKDAKNKAESFELILFKNVDLNLIRQSADAESYNSKIPYYRANLTSEEFTFLKEIIRQSLLQKIEAEE